MHKYKNIFFGCAFILIFILITAVTWIYSRIDSALPIIDGKLTIYGINEKVIVERDLHGIATIKANTRLDIAVATGFIHAQERFFQMDLLRRNSAGELSSLFGSAALNYDKSIRIHRFRDRARLITKQLTDEQLAIIKAYTQGVNQGLHSLKSSPFEYLLLQQDPVEWQEEDTILTVLSMYLDLQPAEGKRERSLGLMKAVFSDEVYQFLNPKGSQWDATIDGTTFPSSPLPTVPWPSAGTNNSNLSHTANIDYNSEKFPGSNNWAVSGKLSHNNSAIVANDMHLGIRVPNTWFRASFEYLQDNKPVKVTGATLPGTPNIIVGSNGDISWGFTNSYGDWSDVIVLETNADKSQYLTPNGFKNFNKYKQLIAIKGQQPTEFTSLETQWGPVIGENHLGQLLAYRWVAHDSQAVNLNQIELELATSVDDAFVVAAKSGMPAQNLMVGDKEGNIGWTIMGPIPVKIGQVGETPVSWSTGENGWQGYLSPEEYPHVKNPQQQRLWTANSRVVGGEMLNKIGNGGYALGARSQQIQQRLFAKEKFSEQDLLEIALDDNAKFLTPWHKFLQDKVLTTEQLANHPHWQEVKQQLTVENLQATTDSVAYRIVRNFRIALRDILFSPLNEKLTALDQGFKFHALRHQMEIPLWQLVNQQPDNYLWQQPQDWDSLFAKALNQTIADMTINQDLSAATWGQQNTTKIAHPLSQAVPFLGYWLDMPATPLSGDSYMPKVQGADFGASQRMVVSPGNEAQGIFHMPTSQAGHPWSPYYKKGHRDWEQGNASPFLPGETKYTLHLLGY
ncbi:penicillin acylase family protein [Thalassotalea sp. PLHSN55]|uniref:penicillin acylase family protein n=1 Tax=Thalassotalea sp. PLHSN55 TaxID=3435888 RepID=UPI003F83E124